MVRVCLASLTPKSSPISSTHLVKQEERKAENIARESASEYDAGKRDGCASNHGTPTRRHALGGSPPRPLRQKICYSDCTENCPLRPCEHPGGFGIRKSASNSGHSPLRGSG